MVCFYYFIPVPVTSVSFSGDGNCILVSTLDDTLRLLDKETGEMLNRYGGIVFGIGLFSKEMGGGCLQFLLHVVITK